MFWLSTFSIRRIRRIRGAFSEFILAACWSAFGTQCHFNTA